LDAACEPDAVFVGEIREAGQSQVSQLRIPYENVFGWDARGKQAFDCGGDHRGTGAAVSAWRGKDLDGDDVLG